MLKKLLSCALAITVAMSMSIGVFAASTEQLSSSGFSSRMSGKSTTVSKTFKVKNTTYKVTGLLYSAEGKEVFKILNQERKANGLKALTWEDNLVQPAIQRALEQYYFLDDKPAMLSHYRPDGRKWRTVHSLANGENLARGATNAEDVMDGWMNSKSHREAILSEDFSSVAVACVETDEMIYWVQLFHSDLKVRADGTKVTSDGTVVNSGQTTSDTATTSAGPTAKSIDAGLTKAKTTAAVTQLKLANTAAIPIDVVKAAASWGTKNGKTVSLTATTLTSTGKSTQGQLTFNPAGFVNNKNAIKTGIYVDNASTSAVSTALAKVYSNKLAVIKCGQSGSYGGYVSIGAKVKLTGLDTSKLKFYNYDAKTGALTKIDTGKTGYTIDKNNYLRFAVTKGGYIVISDKNL